MRKRLALVGAMSLALLALASCVYVGNLRPVAEFAALPASGSSPLDVWLDASASSDADGTIVSFLWNFGDGQTGSQSAFPFSHSFTVQSESEIFAIVLTVVDNGGAPDTAVRYVRVNP